MRSEDATAVAMWRDSAEYVAKPSATVHIREPRSKQSLVIETILSK